jgi:hypothetical protein
MTFFGRDRRGETRTVPRDTEVSFVVRDGADPARVSSPVAARLRDLSRAGMSVATPRLSPDGIHIMYDTLMTVRNRIEAEVRPAGAPPLKVAGTVAWFRADESSPGSWLFGMTFDTPLPPEALPGG